VDFDRMAATMVANDVALLQDPDHLWLDF